MDGYVAYELLLQAAGLRSLMMIVTILRRLYGGTGIRAARSC